MEYDNFEPLKSISKQNGITTLRAKHLSDDSTVMLQNCDDSGGCLTSLSKLLRNKDVFQKLDHPNIAHFIEWHDDSISPCLVLEDIQAISLKDFLSQKDKSQLAVGAFFKVAIQLVDALKTIHQAQIIHKSFTPYSLIINPTSLHTQVIDFTHASLTSREKPALESPDYLEGVLAYISPELTGRMSRSVDNRSDLYTLGVTFYEMLTGELPFLADDKLGLVYAHLAMMPTSISHYRDDLPAELSCIIEKLLQKNPEDRYQSIDGLKRDLETSYQAWMENSLLPNFTPAASDVSGKLMILPLLYGRDNELSVLEEHFDEASQGKNQLLVIKGYSGVGKTSLVDVLHKRIVQKKGLYAQGKFQQLQQTTPYSAVKLALKSWFRYVLSLSTEDLQVLRETLKKELGVNARLLIDFMKDFQLVLGDLPEVPSLGAAETQIRFHMVMQRLIKCVTKEQPWVIFIDDIQWADSGSLSLLSEFFTEADGKLLLIMAFRDNEVDVTHPVTAFISRVKEIEGLRGEPFYSEIKLSHLTEPTINKLIADTLNQPEDKVSPLSHLVYKKAGGNPFFTTEFLKTLYSQKLLDFDFEDQAWCWNIRDIENESITDNVVELMLLKMKGLSDETRNVLQVASCIGGRFNLDRLSYLTELSEDEVTACLKPAVHEGLVIPEAFSDTDVQQFIFLHDRMQQAAYESMTDSHRQQMHLRLGLLLKPSLSTHSDAELLFEVVGHINKGLNYLSQEKYLEVIQLNYQAAIEAKNATVWNMALVYCKVAVSLLPEEHWNRLYQLSLDVFLLYAKCEFLTANHRQSMSLVDQILDKVNTDYERARVLEFSLRPLLAIGDVDNIIKNGLLALSFCELDVPVHEEVTAKFVEIEKQFLDQFMVTGVVQQRAAIPEKICLAYRVFFQLITIAQVMAKLDLLMYIIYKGMNTVIKYGLNEESVSLYALYGLALYKTKQYEQGKVVIDHCFELINQLPSCADIPGIYNALGSMAIHVSYPFKRSETTLMEAHRLGLEQGEIIRGALGGLSNVTIIKFAMGVSLQEVYEHLDVLDHFMHKYGIKLAAGGYYRRLLNMLAKPDSPNLLDDTSFSLAERRMIESSAVKLFIGHLQLQWYFWSNQYDSAWVQKKLMDPGQAIIAGYPTTTDHRFIAAIIACDFLSKGVAQKDALYKSVQGKEELEDSILTSLNELETLSGLCAQNFEHKWLLLQAEHGRIQGRSAEELVLLYEQAIESASVNGFLQYEAFTYERFAEFWRTLNSKRSSDMCVQKAITLYDRWGCQVKVEQLKKAFNVAPTKQRASDSLVSLDSEQMKQGLSAMLRASQAISKEVEHKSLVSNVMQIIMEAADAQYGALVFDSDNVMVLEALVDDENRTQSFIKRTLIDSDNSPVPLSVINYTMTTGKSVNLKNALLEGAFVNDQYILSKRPKSVLCLSLSFRDKKLGVLYLENNKLSGAFGADHINSVYMLLSQAAISFENARMFQEISELNIGLEAKIQRRTEELEKTRRQLLEVQKTAATAEVVRGVAHELNTPLGISITALSIIEDMTKDFNERVSSGILKASELNVYLENVRSSSALLNSNIDKTLELISLFKKTSIQQIDERPACFSMSDFLADLSPQLNELLDAGQHRLMIRCQTGLVLETYAETLKNVILELVKNAVEHGFEGFMNRTLTIEVEPIENTNELQIVVSDNGNGMSQEMADKVFDPFVTSKRGVVGRIGLGNYIVFNLVTQRLEGYVSCQSAKGRGSRFFIQLPVILPVKSQASLVESLDIN